MRARIRRPPVPVAVTLMLGLAACGPAASPDVSADTAGVEAFLERYLDATSARDSTALRSMLAGGDRFAWLEDGAVRYRSASAVVDGLASFPSGTTFATELEELEVVPVASGAAHVRARFTTTVGEGPEGYGFGGMLSFVLERTEDGWRIVGGHASSSGRR